MTSDTDPIQSRLDALKADYQHHLPEQLQSIASLFAVLQTHPAKCSDVEALRLVLHKLAGSAAPFGYRELGKVARQWETWLQPFIENRTIPSSQKCDEMHCFLKQLLQAVSTPDEN